MWISIDKLLCDLTGTIEDGTVTHQVGDVQVEGNATLLRTFQVAGTAKLQVRLGNHKAVIALGHDLHPFAGVGRQLVGCDQHAVGLVRTTPYSASQLVQLRETEALGALDHHHAGVGHVHPHLNDGGGDHDLSLVGHKTTHHLFLLSRLHPTVHLADGELGKCFPHMQVSLLQVLKVERLALLNKGINNVDLPSLTDLLPDKLVECPPLFVVAVQRLHRLTTGRQLVDHR